MPFFGFNHWSKSQKSEHFSLNLLRDDIIKLSGSTTGVSPCGERPIFEPFVEKSPVTVILRALMEMVLAPEKLDELFDQTAQTGYTRELLFSTLVKMMTQVVCSVRSLYGSGL